MGGGAAAPQHPGHWYVEALHSSAHGQAEEDAQDSGKGQVFGGSHRASSKAWMIPAQDGIPSCNTGRRTSVRQHRSQRRNAWLTGGVDIPSQGRDLDLTLMNWRSGLGRSVWEETQSGPKDRGKRCEPRAYLLGVWRHSPPHRIRHSPHNRSPREQTERLGECWGGAEGCRCYATGPRETKLPAQWPLSFRCHQET